MTVTHIDQLAREACKGLPATNPEHLLHAAGIEKNALNIHPHQGHNNDSVRLIMAARTLAETQPEYGEAASHLLYGQLRTETYRTLHLHANSADTYQSGFLRYVHHGVQLGLLQPELIAYDLPWLSRKLVARLDQNLSYAELQVLASQHLLRDRGCCFELPQYAFMRIAIALAIKENQSEPRVAEIYRLLSVRSYSRISSATLTTGLIAPAHPHSDTGRSHLRLVN